MIYGIDYLAGAKYGRKILEAHPAGLAAGFFANTFGNPYPVIRKLLEQNLCPAIRIHAVWEDNHKYNKAKHDDIIRAEYAKLVSLAHEYPLVMWYFSPFCEHTMTARQFRNVVASLSESNVTIVNNPMKGRGIAGFITERHGSKSNPEQTGIFSYDGEDAFGANVPQHKEKFGACELFFMWAPQLNLRKALNDNTPRPVRTYRPHIKHIKTLVEYCYLIVTDDPQLSSRFTYKPVAEDTGDSKSNKIVLISKRKIPFYAFVAGTKLYKLTYFGPFKGGGHRYYSKEWALDVFTQAWADENITVLDLIDPAGKVIGKVCPIVRAGNFR